MVLKQYFTASRQARYSITFALPLLLLYEALTAALAFVERHGGREAGGQFFAEHFGEEAEKLKVQLAAASLEQRLATVAELAALLAREDPFHPEPVADLEETFAALDVGGSVLEGPQLVELARVAGSARAVARDLARIRGAAPRGAGAAGS